jgi:hypothetical protein
MNLDDFSDKDSRDNVPVVDNRAVSSEMKSVSMIVRSNIASTPKPIRLTIVTTNIKSPFFMRKNAIKSIAIPDNRTNAE